MDEVSYDERGNQIRTAQALMMRASSRRRLLWVLALLLVVVAGTVMLLLPASSRGGYFKRPESRSSRRALPRRTYQIRSALVCSLRRTATTLRRSPWPSMHGANSKSDM